MSPALVQLNCAPCAVSVQLRRAADMKAPYTPFQLIAVRTELSTRKEAGQGKDFLRPMGGGDRYGSDSQCGP